MGESGPDIQYIEDADGNAVGVIVPITLWREIESERETAYLLRGEAMKRRLLDAKERQPGITREQKYPPGWDDERVREVLAHYENETEEERHAEIEAARETEGMTMMAVPTEFAPEVRALLDRLQDC